MVRRCPVNKILKKVCKSFLNDQSLPSRRNESVPTHKNNNMIDFETLFQSESEKTEKDHDDVETAAQKTAKIIFGEKMQ